MKKRLTDARIRSLRPKQARYEVWCTEPGFGLRIAPSGRKSFVYLYRFETRSRRFTLGVYPKMSLAAAREAVAKANSLLDKGVDPAEQELKARKDIRDSESFAELAYEWIERHAKPKRKTWQEAKRLLEADAIPAWGRRKANSITRRDVIRLIEQIMDRGAPVVANRNLTLLKQLFKFGVQRDIIDDSPAVFVDRPAKEIPRDRFLSEDEIRALWGGLDKAGITADLRIAIKLCLVTGQRRGEISGMRHSEIEGDWWTLPRERSKNGKAHRIPLSSFAKKLISEASGDDFLFPSRRQDRPVDPRSLTRAMTFSRDYIDTDKFSIHDLRRTCGTYLAALGISQFDISRVLNHTDKGVTATYNRYAYDAEKKKALLKWARRLQNILDEKVADKVVKIS